ncbi:MAG: TonB-dependent siderophore receptor [Burkholderiales bacterium]|nr:TonB-dependent siderophore receptor [Burkholderiales bacterium]
MACPERRPISAAVIALFSTSQFALAQTQSQPTQLPEIRVQGEQEGFRRESTGSATRTETPLRDIPQFINSIPQQVIRERGVTNLQDVLRTVPGISFAAAEGGTQNNQVVYLRGFPLNGDMYIDGIRDLGEYNRDLFATETVEVLKGPSALLFGRGGSGGVINQISKSADLLPRKEVALKFGSFDQKRLTGDLNVKIAENSAIRLVALAEESGSYRFPQDVDKRGFAPSLRLGIGTGAEFSLSYYYLKTNDVTDYGQPTLTSIATGGDARMPPVSPRKYYGFAHHDYTEHETHIATARIDYRVNQTLSIHNTLRAAKFKRDMEATIATLNSRDANGAPVTPATPLSLLMVNRRHDTGRNRNNDDDTIFNQTDLTWKFRTGETRHTMITGMELGRERIDRSRYAIDADPATPGNQAPSALTSFLRPDPGTRLSYIKTPDTRALGEADTLAFYVQDQIEFSDQWKALLGLRWERYKADVRTINDNTGQPTATGGPFSRKDNMVSGRFGVIWQPTERQSYYISVANSFNPSGELGVYGGTSTSLNADTLHLDPEENRNYEIGAHWDITPGLQLRTALFRTEKTNQRIENSITDVLELAGKRRVQGIEFELAGHITSNWEILTGVAFNDGKIVRATVNEGNTPLGVADAQGSVWTVYRLGGGWEVGGGVVATSGFNLTDANNGAVPGHAVFDATVAYVQRKYELRLNVFNIFDKTYYLGGYNNSPNRVLPGMPRAATVTLRYNF